MANEIQELKFQVGEAWKGVYSSSTAYGLANVVQDPTGLSIYRSLKSGNVGHPLSNASWWFRIIDMSSIKAESDRIAALNEAIAQDEALRVAAEELRQQHEAERVAAETQRNEAEQARISAEQARVNAESARAIAEQQRITAEESRVSAESARVQAEQARVLAETLRANAEDQRAANEQNRIAAEQQRIERAEQDHQRAESDHATYVDSLGAFDISSYHATDGVLAKYADLAAALGTNGANIPDDLRKGGMSVKFVQSSDNKYVQYRLMADSFTTDVSQWQGVDEVPTAGSQNLVKSGGVAEQIFKVFDGVVKIEFDVDGYVDVDTGNIVAYSNAKATSNYYTIINNFNHYIYSGDKNFSVAPVAYYDKDKHYIPIAYTQGAASYNKQDINNIIPIPSNAVYVRFSTFLNGTIGNNYKVEIGTEFVKKDDIVNNLTENTPNKPLSAAMGVKLHTDIKQIEDCIKGVVADFNTDAYIDIDTGNIVAYQNAKATSDYYPIIGGSFHYYFTGNKNFSVAPVAYYDENKQFIQVSYPSGAVTYNNKDINDIIPIPSNAVYVRFSALLESGYAVGKIQSETPKIWLGKKWACLGDSLTENNIRTTKHYFDYVRDLTGISIVNCGSGGTGYANRQYGEEAAFYQRVNSIPTDSDVITIFGSFNDIGTKKADGTTLLPLGNIDDTDPSESICGAINLTITNIQNRIPSCRLGVVTPTPWSSCRPTINGNSVCERYVNAIIDICKLRSIPCFDLFRCSNLRPWDSLFRSIAYSKDGTYSEATSSTQNAIQVTASNIDAVHLCGLPNAQIGDWVLPSLAGVHPDELGHKIIAPRFKTFVESLFI